MPFGRSGVKNGPQVFQHRISTEVLRELDGRGVESFVDGMCVYSETFVGHVRLLRQCCARCLPACVLVVLNVQSAVWGEIIRIFNLRSQDLRGQSRHSFFTFK